MAGACSCQSSLPAASSGGGSAADKAKRTSLPLAAFHKPCKGVCSREKAHALVSGSRPRAQSGDLEECKCVRESSFAKMAQAYLNRDQAHLRADLHWAKGSRIRKYLSPKDDRMPKLSEISFEQIARLSECSRGQWHGMGTVWQAVTFSFSG